MAQQAYKIPRITDQQIADILSALSIEFESMAMQASIHAFNEHVANLQFPIIENQAWNALLEQKSDLISRCTISAPRHNNFSINYTRGSHALDDLAITISSSDAHHIRLAARALALFHPVRLPVAEDTEDLAATQRAIQESTFERLQLLQEDMVRQTIQARKELDDQARSHNERIAAEYKVRQEELEKSAATKQAELQQEADALEKRRAEFDDSDNTFARRQIRERMLTEVTNRISHFGVSPETSKSRSPVAAGMTALIGVLAALVAWTVGELWLLKGSVTLPTGVQAALVAQGASAAGTLTEAQKAAQTMIADARSAHTTELIALWIRLSITSLGLAASLIYYIRWQDKWAEQYAQTEFELQQFQLDVHRANWVVETCLEWRKETQSDIPAELVQNLSRGLFAGLKPAPQILHPADELASALMGSASRLSLDINGNKLEVDKPGKVIPKTAGG